MSPSCSFRTTATAVALGSEDEWPAAYSLFTRVAPYLQFSLQTFEQFHHCEKLLLRARGVLRSEAVRPITIELDPDARRYLDRMLFDLLPLLTPGER